MGGGIAYVAPRIAFPDGDPLDGGGGPEFLPAPSSRKHPGPCVRLDEYPDGGIWQTTTFGYDDAGHVVREDEGGATSTWSFDASGDMTSQISMDEPGNVQIAEFWTYDAHRNLTGYRRTGSETTPDSALFANTYRDGHLVESVRTGADGSVETTTWELDDAGQPLRAATVGSRGQESETVWQYDGGALAKRTYSPSATAREYQVAEEDYDDGYLIAASAHTVGVSGAAATATSSQDSYSYFINGLLHTASHGVEADGEGWGSGERHTYDGSGNDIEERDSSADSWGIHQASNIDRTFDADGNLLQEVVTALDPDGTPQAVTAIRVYEYACFEQ